MDSLAVVRLCMFALAITTCASFTVDRNPTGCSHTDAKIVQSEWSTVFSANDGGARRLILVEEMFKRLIKSRAFKAHILRLITDLNLIVNLLHNNGALHAQLRYLTDKRRRYMGAHVSYFSALMHVMTDVLPEVTSPITEHAWTACLAHVGHIMDLNRQIMERSTEAQKAGTSSSVTMATIA